MPNTKTLTHPKGLYFLFFTEVWEQFAYFGMRAILIYYMTKQLLFSQGQASYIYGFYTGLSYFFPFLGGILADRFLGKRASIIIGSLFMALGNFLLMAESLFYVGLLFLIVGSGIFTPSIFPQVNSLYKEGDEKCKQAFSILYLGINVGATLAPLVCGTLGEIYGWKYGFGAAGLGMIIGLVTYLFGKKHLPAESECELRCKELEDNKNKLTKNKIIGFLLLIFFAVLFRAVYNQQGNTLALWIDEFTNRNFFGWEMPASWFQSLNPFIIILFTPIVIKFWQWQSRRNIEPANITKIAIGCILTGASFLLLLPATHMVLSGVQASMFWPAAGMFILTIGELYICPVALLVVTKMAPPRMVSMIAGVWYQSYFLGNCLSGYLGKFWNIITKESFFIMLFLVALIAGIGILVMPKSLKRAIDNSVC